MVGIITLRCFYQRGCVEQAVKPGFSYGEDRRFFGYNVVKDPVPPGADFTGNDFTICLGSITKDSPISIRDEDLRFDRREGHVVKDI